MSEREQGAGRVIVLQCSCLANQSWDHWHKASGALEFHFAYSKYGHLIVHVFDLPLVAAHSRGFRPGIYQMHDWETAALGSDREQL